MSNRNNFIRDIIQKNIEEKPGLEVITRFPPEPNGYLHIGHAKSICLNFGIAEEFNGRCRLRFDDTNPEKEDQAYIDAISEDVRWLGYSWDGDVRFASDYFETLYGWALELIDNGLAYVDDQSAEEMRISRGTLTEPGTDSPYRNRPAEENRQLFEAMRRGDFPDGARVLRAKIDMASGNINLRDPVIYRIRRAHHPRCGHDWCIYPSYDFAHGQSDAIEGVTHSLCTLEFEDHRPLYDWLIEHIDVPARPRQTEFARLNLSHTVLSKRKLIELVEQGHVEGWDDPRMPTISGLRRRGVPPSSLRDFCERIGVAKAASQVEYQLLEHCIREELNKTALRRMAILDPIRLIITNYPDDSTEEFDAVNNPEDPDAGTRKVSFSKEILIEAADFMEDPPKKYFRMAPGREVRLRYAYLVTCTDVIKNDDGSIKEIHATYDPATRGGDAPDGRKVKGTIHWLDAKNAIKGRIRQISHLFKDADPDAKQPLTDLLNSESMIINDCAMLEPAVASIETGSTIQFERNGYFCKDPLSTPDLPVFNQTVGLRDSWAKIKNKKN